MGTVRQKLHGTYQFYDPLWIFFLTYLDTARYSNWSVCFSILSSSHMHLFTLSNHQHSLCFSYLSSCPLHSISHLKHVNKPLQGLLSLRDQRIIVCIPENLIIIPSPLPHQTTAVVYKNYESFPISPPRNFESFVIFHLCFHYTQLLVLLLLIDLISFSGIPYSPFSRISQKILFGTQLNAFSE